MPMRCYIAHVCRQTTSLPKIGVQQDTLRCARELLLPVRTRRSTALRSRAHAAVLAIVIPLTLLSTRGVLEESNGGACDDISLPIPSYKVTPLVLIIHLKGPTTLSTYEPALLPVSLLRRDGATLVNKSAPITPSLTPTVPRYAGP